MINNKKVLAIILARKGSVGLPGKNYRTLSGKPLFLWSVLAAMNSKYVDTIVVTSSCPVIKEEFYNFTNGLFHSDKTIEFIEREEVLNGPDVKNEPVMIDAYNKVRRRLNFIADIVVTLQPTSPIRTNGLIDQCLEKYEKDKAGSLLTVSKNYPFIMYQYGDNAICPNMYYLDRPMRSNIGDSEFALIDNGNVYITAANILLMTKNRLGGKITTFVTDRAQSLQIDTIEDFWIIEKMVEIRGRVI
jgi:CMP-N,N'-diacetyllegionaminic acid synthase